MNDKLESLRKRLRGSEKEKANWPSWIGSPTAWLALIISSITAFYNFLYYSDQLSVVVQPLLARFDDKGVDITTPEPLVFINSGTRPIAVLYVDMHVMQPAPNRSDEPNCLQEGIATISLEFERVVVKPYDTVVKEVHFFENQETISIGRGLDKTRKDLSEPLTICLRFGIVATDASVMFKEIKIRAGWGNFDIPPSPRNFTTQYLIKRNRFWTDVGEN